MGVRPFRLWPSCTRGRILTQDATCWPPITGPFICLDLAARTTSAGSTRTRRSVACSQLCRPHMPAAGYSGARTGVSWCSDSPRKNGFCSWRRAIKNMIGRPRTIEPMPSRNTLPISTLVPGMVQPPR
jgi:hypothetical protein